MQLLMIFLWGSLLPVDSQIAMLPSVAVQNELRVLSANYKGFGKVLSSPEEADRSEQLVIRRVREMTTQLDTRANDEISQLPFRT